MRAPVGVAAGAAIGAGFLLWLTGTRPIDPTGIEFAMKGDWVPHHFGWHFFRIEPWHWPPGTIHGYYAPLGTSIGLTDSIPLAAYLLKPLDRWLPETFQYLGLWLLLCFTLQGALAARLISRWSGSALVQALGATLFVLLPTLLARVGHAALCAHWLILWALLVASRPPARRFPPLEWAALGLMAGLIQPYLAAMVLPLLAAATLTASGAAAVRLTAFGAATLATVSGWWLSGMFVLQSSGSLAEGGLGYYSMNLLAPVSPYGWSTMLPPLPLAGDGQVYEGFQYLGLGNLLLIAAAVALAALRRPAAGVGPAGIWTRPLVVIAVLMAAFAVSPAITFGSHVLADLRGPWSAPLATFRSSGRFFWPLAYLALAWAVATVVRHLPQSLAASALSAAVLLQAADLHDIHEARRRTARDPAFYAWTQPFVSPRWSVVAPHYAHLALVPPPQCGAAPIPYEPVVRLAANHRLTVNAGVIARGDDLARRRYCAELDAAIDAVRLRPDTLYFVSPAAAGVLGSAGSARVVCGPIDAVWICTTPATHAAWRDAAPFD